MAGRLAEVAPGVLVATSEKYLTTSTVVAAPGGGCLVIDPAITVADLAALAAELAARGLRPRAGFSTHPHWDHVLWHQDLGEVPRYAAPAAVHIAETKRDAMVAGVQEDAPGHDMALFGRLVPMDPAATEIGWDGPQARVVTHSGHSPGHTALFLPATGTLVAGDMLSDVEIPLLDLIGADPLGDYRAGLEKLAALPGVRQVVPGHGHVGDAAEFGRRVAADLRYLDNLARGEPFGDPRLTHDWLRRDHETQLRFAARR